MSHLTKTLITLFVGMFVVFMIAASFEKGLGTELLSLESRVVDLSERTSSDITPNISETQTALMVVPSTSTPLMRVLYPNGWDTLIVNSPSLVEVGTSPSYNIAKISIGLRNMKTNELSWVVLNRPVPTTSTQPLHFTWKPSVVGNAFKIEAYGYRADGSRVQDSSDDQFIVTSTPIFFVGNVYQPVIGSPIRVNIIAPGSDLTGTAATIRLLNSTSSKVVTTKVLGYYFNTPGFADSLYVQFSPGDFSSSASTFSITLSKNGKTYTQQFTVSQI